MERVKAEHRIELKNKHSEYEKELKRKENLVETVINDCQAQVQAKESLVEKLQKELKQQTSATKPVADSPTLQVSAY